MCITMHGAKNTKLKTKYFKTARTLYDTGRTGPYHRTRTRALFPSLSHLDVICRLTCKIYFRHGKCLCRSSQAILFHVVSSVLPAF